MWKMKNIAIQISKPYWRHTPVLFKIQRQKSLKVLKCTHFILLKKMRAVWIFISSSFTSVIYGWFQVTLKMRTEVLLWLVLRKHSLKACFYLPLEIKEKDLKAIAFFTILRFNYSLMIIVAVKHTLFKHTVQNFTVKVSIVTFIFFVVLKCLGHQFVLGFIDVLCFI